jgi:hypothetical protein
MKPTGHGRKGGTVTALRTLSHLMNFPFFVKAKSLVTDSHTTVLMNLGSD